MEQKCTLTDEQLIEACDSLVGNLAAGTEKWRMTVPVNFNKDSDMLLSEVIARFKARIATPSPAKAEQEGLRWVKASERIPRHDNPLPVKINGLYRMGNFYEQDGTHRFYAPGSGEFDIPQDNFSAIEWLDESTTPVKEAGQPAGESATKEREVVFAEWIQRKWIPTYENNKLHSWRFFGPHDHEWYGKDYTTSQIYDLWQQSL